MKHIYILLGGMTGPDGWIDSRGMISLGKSLEPYGTVVVRTWSQYPKVIKEIKKLPKDDKVILIGYSGGGSRATWVAGAVYPRTIDLLIAYDPSPSWQMTHIRDNVKKAINYHNNSPLMFGLGGGIIKGKHIENVEIAEQHLAVQFDSHLHQRTIREVKGL